MPEYSRYKPFTHKEPIHEDSDLGQHSPEKLTDMAKDANINLLEEPELDATQLSELIADTALEKSVKLQETEEWEQLTLIAQQKAMYYLTECLLTLDANDPEQAKIPLKAFAENTELRALLSACLPLALLERVNKTLQENALNETGFKALLTQTLADLTESIQDAKAASTKLQNHIKSLDDYARHQFQEGLRKLSNKPTISNN